MTQTISPHEYDAYPFTREHCLSISDFHHVDIERLLKLGAHYLDLSEQKAVSYTHLTLPTIYSV